MILIQIRLLKLDRGTLPLSYTWYVTNTVIRRLFNSTIIHIVCCVTSSLNQRQYTNKLPEQYEPIIYRSKLR